MHRNAKVNAVEAAVQQRADDAENGQIVLYLARIFGLLPLPGEPTPDVLSSSVSHAAVSRGAVFPS